MTHRRGGATQQARGAHTPACTGKRVPWRSHMTWARPARSRANRAVWQARPRNLQHPDRRGTAHAPNRRCQRTLVLWEQRWQAFGRAGYAQRLREHSGGVNIAGRLSRHGGDARPCRWAFAVARHTSTAVGALAARRWGVAAGSGVAGQQAHAYRCLAGVAVTHVTQPAARINRRVSGSALPAAGRARFWPRSRSNFNSLG